jgi:4-hydroxyphenylacetate 3-monooxygenase
MRTGQDYLDSLNDGRAVFVDGERVENVATHPALAPATRVIAEGYDRARSDEHRDVTVYADEATGEEYSSMWRIPRSAEDLAARRRMHEFWARQSYGLMGRTPDHVASLLCGFAGGSDVFARSGQRFGDNVTAFYERARREDLYVAYVIVPPQVDRSKPAHQQPEPFLYAGVSEERDDGIVVSGAQMIGTSAFMADMILVTYIVPLVPGDEAYAFSAVVPVNAPGVRLHPRRPYAAAANSTFDYPLSSRFDEIDSMVVFEDVFIPWESVFAYRDIDLVRNQFTETGAHLLSNFQALTRFAVKLRFAAGLAVSLTDVHSITQLPPVQAQLGGQIAAQASLFDALVTAAVQRPWEREGVVLPSKEFVYTGMSQQRRNVIEVMRHLRELAGGAFLAVPSSEAAFESPETAPDIERYFRSATASARDRVALLRLMWDFVGTEFAGRQLQYEMFYSAAQHVADARVFHSFDWDDGRGLVEHCLSREGAAHVV